MPPRANVLQQVSTLICSCVLPHPTRVGVDGIDAAGKTTFADDLRPFVEKAGRAVIRAAADGFHRPRSERYRRGTLSPDGYLNDSFDVRRLRSALLAPLGPSGNLRYKTAIFDYHSNSPVDRIEETAAPDAILLFDGIFLFRPELHDCWDFHIWIEVDPDLALARALRRDAGPRADVELRYRQRYMPAQQMYIDQYRPQQRADMVVINNDPLYPELRVRGETPLTK